MKLIFVTIGIVTIMLACQSSPKQKSSDNIHEVVVKEVLQTSNYTYLLVEEDDSELWLAVTAINAEIGETYYYEGGMLMTNFESKELQRTFESILFLDKISNEPITAKNLMGTQDHASSASPHTSKLKVEKKDIMIEPDSGGITIAELFSNKESYSNKTVKVRGLVTKYNALIMGKNWIHLQDGTSSNEKFDLTVTSDIEFNVGDTVTVEGKITLNKDFGYNYFYEVLMEEAVIK